MITGVASAASAAAVGAEGPAAVVGAVAAAALEAEGSGEMGEPAAVGASKAWEAALDDVLYSTSPSTNLEADPAKSDASDIFLYALAGCFPFHCYRCVLFSGFIW